MRRVSCYALLLVRSVTMSTRLFYYMNVLPNFEPNTKPTFVPHRQLLLLSIGWIVPLYLNYGTVAWHLFIGTCVLLFFFAWSCSIVWPIFAASHLECSQYNVYCDGFDEKYKCKMLKNDSNVCFYVLITFLWFTTFHCNWFIHSLLSFPALFCLW